MEKLTNELIDYILDLHNKYRHEIATGQIKPYEKAARMATLVCKNKKKKNNYA